MANAKRTAAKSLCKAKTACKAGKTLPAQPLAAAPDVGVAGEQMLCSL
jgi:hypothetical protein